MPSKRSHGEGTLRHRSDGRWELRMIEEDGSVIHIRQAVKVVKGTVSIGSPKSKDSIRDIPVPLNVRP